MIGYNEEYTRQNMRKVKHPNDVVVSLPTAEPEVVVEVPTNYVQENFNCGREVSRLNKLKQMQLRQQLTS